SASAAAPASSVRRVCGTASTNRNPRSDGCGRDSVTVPITSAIRMSTTPLLVADADDRPPRRRLPVADQRPGRRAVAGEQHQLAGPGPDGVDGQQRVAV